MSRFGIFKRLFGGEDRDARDRREKPRAQSGGGLRILVVDDSLTILAVMRKMLAQNNYVVLEAVDAEKGVEIALGEQPDLVFLDIVLPGMNGFAALRQLRRDPRTREIPVIMMSGNEQATEQFYAQRIGADDFMKKPFSRAELFTRIEQLFTADQQLRRPAGTRAKAGE
ncbi:MAG: PleD family two-component system response regulator [Lysobacterales bacterium]